MELIASSLVIAGVATILATSFNLVIGYAGLMSIAHPIFYALGAYGAALLAKAGFSVPVAILGGAVIAGVASFSLSLPTLRVSGEYFVIASIGFQLGVLQIIKNLDFTGGPGGLTNIPTAINHSFPYALLLMVCIVWLCALATIGLVGWLVSGPYGRLITAMRDDEEALSSLGRGALKLKCTLFAIACSIAGLAGGLYAHQFQYISPDQFDIVYSAAILTMVVIGGIRTVWGPFIGAILLQTLPQIIRFIDLPSSIIGSIQGLIYTSLVIIFLFVRPEGLVGRGGSQIKRPVADEE